jgi:hypothetical protein
MTYEFRSEAAETEVRRGFSQARTMQAYPLRYVEEAEREKPRRARVSADAVGVHGSSLAKDRILYVIREPKGGKTWKESAPNWT